MIKTGVAVFAILTQSFSAMGCQAFENPVQPQQVQRSVPNMPRTKTNWRAASYKGLTIGKSTRADMIRVLGDPQWSGSPGDQLANDPNPETWSEYESGGEFPGKLTVILDERSGVISGIDLYPENLSRDEAIKHFGNDYILARYDFDQCLGNEESAPLYESPDGQIVNIEYRARGIAVGIDQTGKVKQINYVSKPLGATESKCKQSHLDQQEPPK